MDEGGSKDDAGRRREPLPEGLPGPGDPSPPRRTGTGPEEPARRPGGQEPGRRDLAEGRAGSDDPPSGPLGGERAGRWAPAAPRGPAVRPPARVIAFANQKGGVGKTTTVINLGAALAELDHRVLLVDMDPQGSLGVGLASEPHTLEVTVYNLLMGEEDSPDEAIIETGIEGVHLLPANIDLAGAELSLVQEVAREQSLRRVLERVRYRYDFILIDCPPSLGLLTVNGLTAADGVIIPLECEYFALRGMGLLMETIRKVQGRLNTELEVKGILATMVDTRTIHAREVLDRVHEAFGDLVFKTTINRTIRFAEAPVAGESILTYSPESKGTVAYRELAREVLQREQTSQPARS